MATILKFRGSSGDAPKSRQRQSRRSAEIVIFPGVRYERWSSEAAQNERATAAIPRESLKLAE